MGEWQLEIGNGLLAPAQYFCALTKTLRLTNKVKSG